eukprot:2573467-Rhodomonas_salina.1
MGVGCVFATTNNELHQGAHNCAVSGEAALLWAEAVVLDLLLDHTDPSQKLAEFQKHKDVIIPLAVKLASRAGETVLVKVKSHMGVSLNEEADIEANKGLSSQEYSPAPRLVAQRLLAPMDSTSCKISDFNSQIQQRVTHSGLDSLLSEGGLNTESYLYEGLGQSHLYSTLQALPEKLQCCMLQLLGGIFPCGLLSYHISRAESLACDLCC